MGIAQNDGFIKENPMKMDDLGVPLLQETSTCVETKWALKMWYMVVFFLMFIDVTRC